MLSVLLFPAASITQSAPSPSRALAHSVASPVRAVQPYCFAIDNRLLSDSNPRTATSAPLNLAIAAQRIPMVPGPITTTRSPGLINVFSTTALYATQQGSVKHACSKARLSGTLCRHLAGTFTNFVIAPFTPYPKPFRVGSRLYN